MVGAQEESGTEARWRKTFQSGRGNLERGNLGRGETGGLGDGETGGCETGRPKTAVRRIASRSRSSRRQTPAPEAGAETQLTGPLPWNPFGDLSEAVVRAEWRPFFPAVPASGGKNVPIVA